MDPGIKLMSSASPALAGRFFTILYLGSPLKKAQGGKKRTVLLDETDICPVDNFTPLSRQQNQ